MILNILKLIILFFHLQIATALSETDVAIKVIVEDEIITNYDIKKESEYLKLLNNNLQNLSEDKILLIAKNNIVNEIIKKNETKKIFDIEKENPIINKIYENLFKRIGFQNEQEFNNALLNNDSYTSQEIKEKLKIEVYWNDLVYLNYKDQIFINEKDLKNKLNLKKNNLIIEYFLSEIIFEKKINISFEDQINKIKESVNLIGFNNTANIYSISESSKFGGKVGWVNENSLSEIILEKIKNKKIGEISDPIQIGNNYLIIKIEDKREKENSIDEEEELKKIIEFEKNKQLNRFSNIYFNKAKQNYSINEK